MNRVLIFFFGGGAGADDPSAPLLLPSYENILPHFGFEGFKIYKIQNFFYYPPPTNLQYKMQLRSIFRKTVNKNDLKV